MLNKVKTKNKQKLKTKQSVPSKSDGVKSIVSEDRYYPSVRMMVCRDCDDDVQSDQTEKWVWDIKQELDVPVSPRCPTCNGYNMDWPKELDGTRHDAINEERIISKKKSFLIKNSDDYEKGDPKLMDLDSPIRADDSYTMEPPDGFDSSGIIERDMYHKGDIHETAYISFVNPGNTPHMQRKIPMEDLLAIRNSKSKALLNIWEEKTYGSAALNRDMKNKMGFSIECDNKTGQRKLSDQDAFRALNNIFFGKEWIKKNTPTEKGSGPEFARLLKSIEDKEYEVARNITVLKTGDKHCGVIAPEYEVRDNKYDTVDLTKLALETDVPWADIKTLDLYKMYKSVKKEKARIKKQAKLDKIKKGKKNDTKC